jgi:hypothetical protein
MLRLCFGLSQFYRPIVSAERRHADKTGMARYWMIALFFSLLTGCGGKTARMERPEDPQGRYRDQIAAAQRLLEQKEDWADRAEWEVLPSGDGWEVIAWRVEHPERRGPNRYVPWGYSVIELDSRSVAIDYHRKG